MEHTLIKLVGNGSLYILRLFTGFAQEFDGSGAPANTSIHIVNIIAGLIIGIAIIVPIVFILRKRYAKAQEGAQNDTGVLQAEKNKSNIILNAIQDGVVVIDTQNIIRLCNPAGASSVGWTIGDALGIDYRSVFRFIDAKGVSIEDDPFTQALRSAENIRNNDLMMQSKSDKRFFVSISVSPIRDSDNQMTGVVAIFRDITQEKNEEQRRAEFISTASHEMRTPVAAIEGYLALAMNDKVSKIDNKAREFLLKAHSSTQHLGTLFQDLLTSAKAEDGRLVSHPVVVEVGAFLEQIVESLRFAAEKKGLLMDFTIGLPGEGAGGGKTIKPLYYVNVDADRMREVITNIFDNAVKYTSNGKISIGLTGDNEVVQFYVRDTGPGIPPEDVPHLFQKFYRVDNSTTRTIGGTGLGLFICRKIVELYNGRIWAESQVGVGSTFYINLPRLSGARALELQRAQAAQQTPAPITSLTTPV